MAAALCHGGAAGGLTAGTPWQGDFEASDAVTAQDAAALLCTCLDLDAEPEAHLAALEECGLSLPDREKSDP